MKTTMKNSMNHTIKRAALALVFTSVHLPVSTLALEKPEEVVAAAVPGFTTVAEGRAEGIVKSLELGDVEKTARVKRDIVNFIIRVKNVHEGPEVSEEEKRPRLDEARRLLYAGFDTEKLTDGQRLIIKNGLCANHFKINYDSFLELVPKLTADQKTYIHKEFAEVCDEAILLNSGTEKGALFVKRRGRVNTYLSKQGYDLKALSIERNERNKARAGKK